MKNISYDSIKPKFDDEYVKTSTGILLAKQQIQFDLFKLSSNAKYGNDTQQ